MAAIAVRGGCSVVGEAGATVGYVLSSEICAREDVAEFKVRGVRGDGGWSGKGLMSAGVGGRTCREAEGVDVMTVSLSCG